MIVKAVSKESLYIPTKAKLGMSVSGKVEC